MSPTKKAQVLIVDDHPMIRERLSEFIRRQPDLDVCGDAATATEALAIARRTQPDVAIVDLSLHDSSGLDLIHQLRAELPAVRVLVLSMHDESLYAERVLHAGAQGYVTKQEATQSVIAALRRVLSGEVYLSDRMTAQLLQGLTATPTGGAALVRSLTDRELEVFRLIGHGLGTRQIAEKLDVGVKTIESYRDRIKRKLRIASGAQLVQQAVVWVQQSE
jgi:DNA-binding NarL/FixJ family response regulator